MGRFLRICGSSPRRGGFSLVLVLLIALCGSALMGAIIYMIGGFSGASRATIRDEEIYILLQGEVERSKAALKLAMNDASEPFGMSSSIDTINNLDDLVVCDSSGVFPPARVDRTIDVGGTSAALSVRIFDMQYPPEKVNDDDDLITSLPPSMAELQMTSSSNIEDETPKELSYGKSKADGSKGTAGSGSAGVYLIRATVVFSDGTRSAIETSLIQSTGK
ncbi:MAG: hypothetical protein LBS75_01455 [Synergistaceae bacterium]|jgi:hypothetical protein|nr:hypothetical protein [Synergistaceae bacterium]